MGFSLKPTFTAIPGLSIYICNNFPWFPKPDKDNLFPPIDSHGLNNPVLNTQYLTKQGMYEEAIEAHKKLAVIDPSTRADLALTYLQAGQREKALKILAELEKEEATPFLAIGLAELCAALGKHDEAFRWLAYEPHHIFLPWIINNSVYKPMRDDPRFKELLRKMNLPEPDKSP